MNAPSQVSFLPDDYLDSKRQRRTNAMCAALFLVMVGGIGSAFTYMEQSMKGIDKELADVNQHYADAARPIAQFRTMQEKQRKMDAQAALTASLLERVPRSYLLAQVTNALPMGVSLLDFSLDAKVHAAAPAPAASGVAAPRNKYELKKAEMEAQRTSVSAASPEVKAYDVYLKLTGVADSDVRVAAYIKQLSNSPLFQDVNLVVSDEYELSKQKVRRFQIEFSLNPDADVRPIARTTTRAHVLEPVKKLFQNLAEAPHVHAGLGSIETVSKPAAPIAATGQ